MPRYYFDVRDGDHFAIDPDGLDLPGIKEARTDASMALAEMVRDAMPDGPCRAMAIEVRGEDKEPLVKVQILFEVERDPLAHTN
jgi:hypothetical protein